MAASLALAYADLIQVDLKKCIAKGEEERKQPEKDLATFSPLDFQNVEMAWNQPLFACTHNMQMSLMSIFSMMKLKNAHQ